MDTRLYVMTHKEYTKPDDDLYISMHVGHALGNEFGYVADDTGDNISAQNRHYCELTGLYWIWKNVTCDIVGICHYRRYFVREEAFLTQEYIERTLEKYDVIVPNSGSTKYANNWEHYKQVHIENDMVICRDVLTDKYPEYLSAFELCMNTNLATLGNMMIARKDIYDKYCQWLFDILFEVERRVDISDYDTFQARIFGYLSERLLRVWLMANSYRVKEEEARMIDPADADNAKKRVDKLYRWTELFLSDLTTLYQKGIHYDLADISPLDIDFNGKIPVFVCWWQGLENAPELVKKCIESIDRNVPADIAEVHLITLENVGMYISLPEWIVDKFENGSITMTHLSDILRMALLARYGGMWLDATYYMPGQLSPDIFEKPFWTIRLDDPKWKADIAQGRWAGNCLYIKQNAVLPRYALNAMFYYWKKNDSLIDYFLIDYIIAVAYNNLAEVGAAIDGCEYSNAKTHRLGELLDAAFSEEKYSELIEDTSIFKLSYKQGHLKENFAGKMTFYGYILSTP